MSFRLSILSPWIEGIQQGNVELKLHLTFDEGNASRTCSCAILVHTRVSPVHWPAGREVQLFVETFSLAPLHWSSASQSQARFESERENSGSPFGDNTIAPANGGESEDDE